MKLRFNLLFCFLSMLLCTSLSNVYAQDRLDPVAQMELAYKTLSENLVKINNGGGSEEEYMALVDQELMKYVDMDLLVKGVVGRQHWGKWQAATKSQQDQFMYLFRRLVIHTYSNSIRSFKQVDIKFLPVRASIYQNKSRVTVHSVVNLSSGDLNIDYKLYWHGQQWKIYDFMFSGISFLKMYRDQINPLFKILFFSKI